MGNIEWTGWIVMDEDVNGWRYFVCPGTTLFSYFNNAGIEKVDMMNSFYAITAKVIP